MKMIELDFILAINLIKSPYRGTSVEKINKSTEKKKVKLIGKRNIAKLTINVSSMISIDNLTLSVLTY